MHNFGTKRDTESSSDLNHIANLTSTVVGASCLLHSQFFLQYFVSLVGDEMTGLSKNGQDTCEVWILKSHFMNWIFKTIKV